MFDQSMPDPHKVFAEREFFGEKIVWVARPDVKIAFLMSFAVWLFAIPWTAFSLIWTSVPVAALLETYAGLNLGAPKGAPALAMWTFALWGVPFVLVGFEMLLVPAMVLMKGARTLYVLTNGRLAILNGGRNVEIVSIGPQEIVSLSRKEKPDGRGTLILHLGFERDSDGDLLEKKIELGVINEVRRVEQLVLDLKNKSAA
jgi:hypothetical protein